MTVEARLWEALTEIEDPEIPISVVHMGLIVAIDYADGVVDLKLTFTAMGCPAMDFIQDDIRDRLLQEPEVDEVEIEIVWDPVWTRKMIREDAQRYVIDCPFPQQFDSEKKEWGGVEIGWDEVLTRWKGRGPMNETYVAKLQKGYRG